MGLTSSIITKSLKLKVWAASRRSYRTWIRIGPDQLEQLREERTGFEDRLQGRWRESLEGLELEWLKSYEAGKDFHERHQHAASEAEDFVFPVLVRLHARACRTTLEVLTLLRAGHADGAHARWRTLHEIAVTMFFISEHGNEVAERYLLHNDVVAWHKAQQYQRFHSRLGYEPIDEEELLALERTSDDLLKRFGKSYESPYGWASDALDHPRPGFAQIEESQGMDHWRPWFRMASESVHAGSHRLTASLGSPDLSEEMISVGPSNFGLSDPGVGTAVSLSQATLALLTSRTDLAGLRAANAIQLLAARVEKAFGQAAAKLEADIDAEHGA